jgi:CheY-like chemotaxis protein
LRNRSPGPDILVVDDDATLREGLIDLFRLEGRRAVGASNGADALFILGKGSFPRVILLDLNMPIMDGWDFVSALERMPDLPRIPIVVMSGVTSNREIPSREADAGFFEKPVNFDALLAAVNLHLPHREISRPR